MTRFPRLWSLLTGQPLITLEDDPTWVTLKTRIDKARARHQPCKRAQSDLAEYMVGLLRRGVSR